VADRPTLRQRRAHETRELLLDAARRVFAAKGYADTTIDDVALAAGASKGAVYHHFATKEELFRQLVGRDDPREFLELEQAVQQASSLPEVLDAIVAAWLDHYRAPAFIPLSLEFRIQAMRQAWFKQALGRFQRAFREMLAGLLEVAKRNQLTRADLDPHQTAVVMFGLLDGVCLAWAIDPSDIDLDALRAGLLDSLTRIIEPTDTGQGLEDLKAYLTACVQEMAARRH
jgi:AcrR family transcriptional regulator